MSETSGSTTPHIWAPFEIVGVERVYEAEIRLRDQAEGEMPYALRREGDPTVYAASPLETVDGFLVESLIGDPSLRSAIVYKAIEERCVYWRTLGITEEQFTQIAAQAIRAFEKTPAHFQASIADQAFDRQTAAAAYTQSAST